MLARIGLRELAKVSHMGRPARLRELWVKTQEEARQVPTLNKEVWAKYSAVIEEDLKQMEAEFHRRVILVDLNEKLDPRPRIQLALACQALQKEAFQP